MGKAPLHTKPRAVLQYKHLAPDTWHPNKWEFTFDEAVPEDVRSFILVPIVETG
ncbi:MAG TPA: hypothetical protein VEF35_02590 [Candidatus Bathyarchaeia archaeon]|nr:hypothetical protein [Candidatus Bathyarchaeia archaeon]